MKKGKILTLALFAAFLIISCSYVATNNAFFAETTQKVYNGNYGAAIAAVKGAKEQVYQAKDRVLYYLDIGMLYHYNGEYQLSNEFLTKAEQSIEELYTKSISRAAMSMVLNDNTLEYSGEEYEDLYLNIFKALNYVHLDNADAAFVEIRRLNEKLNLLEDKYARLSSALSQSSEADIKVKAGDNRFYNSALGRYLSLLLYRSKNRWDDVRIDNIKFNEAWQSQPDIYNYTRPDISVSLDKQADSRLNVMCFSGKSPEKRARTWWIRTFKDHIFIGESKESLMGDKVSHYVDMIYWKDVTDNLFFKFQIPLLKSQPSEVKRIELVVDGKIWQPELLENIERIAVSTFELKKDLIYFKTIIRTVSKGLLAKKGKDRIEENVQSELFSSLLNLSADLALSASEQADLRISRYFPKLAHIEEIHLPAGTHTLQVNYYDKYGKRIYSDNHGTIELKPNQLNLVESFCLK